MALRRRVEKGKGEGWGWGGAEEVKIAPKWNGNSLGGVRGACATSGPRKVVLPSCGPRKGSSARLWADDELVAQEGHELGPFIPLHVLPSFQLILASLGTPSVSIYLYRSFDLFITNLTTLLI